jgi:hypothetical protein
MKSWLRELCPEIDAWQVDMIAQHMEEAINAEREACAKVAEQTVCDTHIPTGVRIYGSRAAAAIRARQSL